jgi:polysaccharide biosynthesis/export protein
VLYIKIITTNDKLNKLFNPEAENTTATYNEQSIYLKNYPINDSGYIELPVLNKIRLVGLTVEEAKAAILSLAGDYLTDAQIIVRLANFRYTILGEVKQPGVKKVFDEKISLMEAIAYAGDITYNGNRQRILVIRPSEKGSITYRVDATDGEIVKTEEFFIMPNDIIYVEPLRSTLFRERASDYMFVLTTFTSTISALLLILNFVK